MPGRLSSISEAVPQAVLTATLRVDTPGIGFTEITRAARDFLTQAGAGEGVFDDSDEEFREFDL